MFIPPLPHPSDVAVDTPLLSSSYYTEKEEYLILHNFSFRLVSLVSISKPCTNVLWQDNNIHFRRNPNPKFTSKKICFPSFVHINVKAHFHVRAVRASCLKIISPRSEILHCPSPCPSPSQLRHCIFLYPYFSIPTHLKNHVKNSIIKIPRSSTPFHINASIFTILQFNNIYQSFTL